MNRYFPAVWLAAHFLLATVFLAQQGKLHPEWVVDTGSYVNFPVGELRAGMNQVRTFGYPMFLRFDPFQDSKFRAIPSLQLLVHFAAVCLFYRALTTLSFPAWAASFIATGILWSNSLLRFVQMLTPDCLAHSLAVMAIAWTMILVHRRSARTWLALIATVMVTYHTRPAYLFLLPVLPLLGFLLICLRDYPIWCLSKSVRLAGRIAAATFLPFLGFASLRWLLVGSFGLVSFGGYNAAGVIGQFADAQVLPELRSDVQPLVARALELRQEVYAELGLAEDVTTSYITIEQRFDASTWRVFVPAAREIVAQQGFEPTDAMAVNHELSQVARSVVEVRPQYYAIWLAKAAARAIYILFSELIVNFWFFLLMLTTVLMHFLLYFRHKSIPNSRPAAYENFVTPVLTIAILFSAAKMALVIITTPPLSRFIDPAGVFWPTVLSAVVATQFAEWHTIASRTDKC